MENALLTPVIGANQFEPTARPPTARVLETFSRESRRHLRRLLSQPCEYVWNDAFNRPRVAHELFGADVSLRAATQPWCNAADVDWTPEHGIVIPAPLSIQEEQGLFLRLNYGRYRIAKVLAKFAGKRLNRRAAAEILWWHAKVVGVRCEIVQANVPLVLAMAKRSRMGNMDYAELISEGNMALLRSVDKFDCSRGFKFSTYACRAILKSFSRVAVRTSRYRNYFPTEFDPSLEKSNFSEQQRLVQEAECVNDLRGILTQNLAELSDVESTVIRERFALNNPVGAEAAPKTLEQVGTMIGVTKERVRQIQNRALAKLRLAMQEEFMAA